MLDNEPDDNQSTSTTNLSEAPATPRRRRAASRPAGPPSSAPDAPPIQPATVTAEPAAVTAEPAPATSEPATVTPEPGSPAAEPIAGPLSADPTDTPPAKKTPRKRTTKKVAATEPAAPAAPSAEGDPTGATSDEVLAEVASPRARAPRKRAVKKAPAAAEQSADDLLAEAAVAPTATDPAPGAWAAEEAVAEVSVPAEGGAGPATGPDVVADPSEEQVEAALQAEPVADLAPLQESPLDALESTEQRENGDTVQVQEPTAEPAEPAEPAPVDDASEQEPDDEDEDEEGEPDSREGDGRRRRRRRGGRRRRRTGGEDPVEGSTADSRDDGEQPTQPPGSAGEDEPSAAEHAAEDAGTDEDEGDPEGEGTRRRRRRRRRRGEESAGAPDDPTEVVVRVREPRRNTKSASSEVTGIEGSTRMEAKRQRRRDGREAGRRRTPILSEAEFLARRESVSRKMIIRQAEDPSAGSGGGTLSQIAVVEDDILVEHYVDRDSAASLIGNVYLGRVQNVLPSMEAAFVDIGRGRNAVLYAGEVDWDSFGAEGQGRKVERVLKSGQTILVQVTKDPVGAKGARLTNHVSIPGRYIVYAPSGHLSGISRKLPDTERRRLKDILADLIGEASVIVRTAAEGASEEELVRDVNRLKAQWADIEKRVSSGQSPQLLYGEPDLTVRIVRDLFTEDFSELIIQGNGAANDAFAAVQAYVAHVAPHLEDRLRGWDPATNGDLFGAFRLDEQIAKGLERKVFLPSGGSLVIDRTEAMTVIDVNTGKFTGSGGNLEATVTSNNLEAAEEIVNQLRLRDIGGIIVIDFIDMVLPANRELLLRRLVECLGRDRTRHQVAEVTSLGLVQMTRKKIGTGLAEAFTTECPHCHGRGFEIHELPVESQRQADGGSRDQRGRDSRRGGGGSAGSGDHGSQGGGRGSSGHGSSGNGGQPNGRRGPKPPDLSKLAASGSASPAEEPSRLDPEAEPNSSDAEAEPSNLDPEAEPSNLDPEAEPGASETVNGLEVKEQPVLAGGGSAEVPGSTEDTEPPSRGRRGGTRRRATREQGAPAAATETADLAAIPSAPESAAADPTADSAPPAEESQVGDGQTVADPQAAPDDDEQGEPVASS